jgi:hypothetical protein
MSLKLYLRPEKPKAIPNWDIEIFPQDSLERKRAPFLLPTSKIVGPILDISKVTRKASPPESVAICTLNRCPPLPVL